MAQDDKKRTRVTFLHLDLGIGGAERLVVDSAVQLQKLGYNVRVLTSHHDMNHCFVETRETASKGGLHDVISVHGDWLPRYINISMFSRKENCRRFTALCGIIRMMYLSIVMIVKTLLSTEDFDHHVVFLDGLSASILLFNAFGFPVLFYCHFPDRYK